MCLFPKIVPVDFGDGVRRPCKVPCKKCTVCNESYTNLWALRICLEASLHSSNACFTLTYDDDHLPDDHCVHQEHVAAFVKRLRSRIAPQKIRYFYCAEYGDRRLRPHYHFISFGYCPDDLVPFFYKDGQQYYKSASLAETWQNGNILVGNVNLHTARYCALYMQKTRSDLPLELIRPFVHMSLKPGIGVDALFDPKRFDGRSLYFDGRKFFLPRYFLTVLERQGVDVEDMLLFRRSFCLVDNLDEIPDYREYDRLKYLDFLKKSI